MTDLADLLEVPRPARSSYFDARVPVGLLCLGAVASPAYWLTVTREGFSEFAPGGPWFAEIFLHGHVGMPLSAGETRGGEYLYYNGATYGWNPPLPYLLQVPLVALLGACCLLPFCATCW